MKDQIRCVLASNVAAAKNSGALGSQINSCNFLKPGRYRLCWCAAGFQCASSWQHNVDVGSLTLLGPSFEQHRTCVSGQTCFISSLSLESLTVDGSFMTMETCARSDAVVAGWPSGAVASAIGASGTTAYWGNGVILGQGGRYRICWCGDGICNSVQRYSLDIGSVALIGPSPLQYARTCISGRICEFHGVKGEGLQVGDAWQVSSSCGSTAVLPGLPSTGYTLSVSSGSVSWGSMKISSSGGQYKLCWCSASFPCAQGDDFRLEVGTLDVVGPAPLSQDRTCISGTTCLSLGLTGHFIDSTTYFAILATCGKLEARGINEIEVVRWGRGVLTAPGGKYRLCWCMPVETPWSNSSTNVTDGCRQWTQFETDAGSLQVIGPAPWDQRQTCISGQSCKLEVGGVTTMLTSRVLLLETCGVGMQLPGTYFGPEAFLAGQQNVSDMAMYNTEALMLAGGTYRLCWCAGLNLAFENSTEGCYDSAHFQTDFGSIEIVGPWPLEQHRTCVSGMTCQIEGVQGRILSGKCLHCLHV